MYRFKTAKKHGKETGVGMPVNVGKQSRERYDSNQLEHFIDFLTSGNVVKDLPYGEKTLRMCSGEVIEIPSVIRSLAPSTIVKQYEALCEEENVKPLGL